MFAAFRLNTSLNAAHQSPESICMLQPQKVVNEDVNDGVVKKGWQEQFGSKFNLDSTNVIDPVKKGDSVYTDASH